MSNQWIVIVHRLSHTTFGPFDTYGDCLDFVIENELQGKYYIRMLKSPDHFEAIERQFES